MTEQEKTKFCSNCESQIPISKFMLHERFCSSNVQKCPICKKPVIIEEMEDHNKEFHVLMECEYCQKKFTADKIEEHRKKCDCRMTECQYCEMQIQIKDKKNHEYICGSKTEECPICKKLIPKKDWKEHKKIGCKSQTELLLNAKNQNNYYNEIFERENRKRIQELEEKTRKTKINEKNNNNKINNNPIKTQNALPIENKTTPVSLPINNNINNNNNNNHHHKVNNNSKNNINNNLPVNSQSNNISANNKKIGVTSVRFGTNKYQFKSNSIAGNNENDNYMNNNNKNNNQPIKANENIFKGKLIDPNEEKDKNKNGIGRRQSKPTMNMKFGDKNPSKTNLLNNSKTSFRDTKTSFKFEPKIDTKNNKLKNNNNNNIIKSSNKKVNSKPFGKINFDDGDFLPDDVEIGANFDDEKEIQEAIQRSLWQK